MNSVSFKEIDLAKCRPCVITWGPFRGETHNSAHDDIDPSKSYLVKINDDWYAGQFSRETSEALRFPGYIYGSILLNTPDCFGITERKWRNIFEIQD